MYTNLTQHTVYLCWHKRDLSCAPHHLRFGPAYTVASATALIMVRPTYVMLKIGKQVDPLKDPYCSWMYACTLVGYLLLGFGTVWAANLWGKLRRFALGDAKEV
mmetsp:Transcript_32975/g.94712  ORF Transcript_32975/g.94712 Transcript_32975/m.94712 type:complete len:104 (-) Transcript_32975:80-391(-)